MQKLMLLTVMLAASSCSHSPRGNAWQTYADRLVKDGHGDHRFVEAITLPSSAQGKSISVYRFVGSTGQCAIQGVQIVVDDAGKLRDPNPVDFKKISIAQWPRCFEVSFLRYGSLHPPIAAKDVYAMVESLKAKAFDQSGCASPFCNRRSIRALNAIRSRGFFEGATVEGVARLSGRNVMTLVPEQQGQCALVVAEFDIADPTSLTDIECVDVD